jgi:DNA modification methylase
VLLGDEKAQMVFIDPPYNVRVDDIVNHGKTKHKEFAEASGEMSSDDFIQFLTTIYQRLMEFSIDGSIHYICMDWEHGYEMITALRATYGQGHRKTKDWFKNRCIWVKDMPGLGAFYRSLTEDIYVVKNGKKKHINNFELGQYGRFRTNVWQYAKANSFASRPRDENNKTVSVGDLAYHPTPKSKEMVADAIRDCSNPKGIILDAFGGSGTTLIAAEMTERRGYLIEIDRAYTQTIIKRYAQMMQGKQWDFKHLNGNLTIEQLCSS